MRWPILFLFVALAYAAELPEGPGKALVEGKCVGCHAIGVVTELHASRDDWEASVDRMTAKGVWLSDEEFDTIVGYLSEHFGVEKTVNVNTAAADELRMQIGLTESEAVAVVERREKFGKFEDWQAVANVDGVPADKIEKVKDRLTF